MDHDMTKIILDLHRMTVEQYKAKKEKKAKLEARLAANPLAKGPGRPRGPVLVRIGDKQEFMTIKGERVFVQCLPWDPKCRKNDHVERIMVAYDRLKAASVRVTVKNIRSLGIGAGTFIDNRQLLPQHIIDDLALSSKDKTRKSAFKAPPGQLTNAQLLRNLAVEPRKQVIFDTNNEHVNNIDRKEEEQEEQEEQEESSKENSMDCIHQEMSQYGIGSWSQLDYPATQSGFDWMNEDQQTQHDIETLIANEDFKNATFVVDGVFDYVYENPGPMKDAARHAASFWVAEVENQRRLHGLPLVNMRPSVCRSGGSPRQQADQTPLE